MVPQARRGVISEHGRAWPKMQKRKKRIHWFFCLARWIVDLSIKVFNPAIIFLSAKISVFFSLIIFFLGGRGFLKDAPESWAPLPLILRQLSLQFNAKLNYVVFLRLCGTKDYLEHTDVVERPSGTTTGTFHQFSELHQVMCKGPCVARDWTLG